MKRNCLYFKVNFTNTSRHCTVTVTHLVRNTPPSLLPSPPPPPPPPTRDPTICSTSCPRSSLQSIDDSVSLRHHHHLITLTASRLQRHH